MAFLQFDKDSGRYRIRFHFGGQEFKRSIKTKDRKIAQRLKSRVEEAIWMLEQGRLTIPLGIDPALFILSDGKLTAKLFGVLEQTLSDIAQKVGVSLLGSAIV